MSVTSPRARAEPLSAGEVRLIDAYWRAANYLSVGQIYLLDNPLLREPLAPEHVKPRLLGHWGTTPGLNFIYAHMNRLIRRDDLDAIYIAGPGHGGPGLVANAYLEGTYTETYPSITTRRGGPAQAVPSVLVPGRHPEPRCARDARFDPRGRRARIRAHPRVRSGLRQPGPGRVLRRRRRRGRDGAARGELALQQVPEPRDRRGRPADPPPERLQDREPDGPRPDPDRRARGAVRGLRPPADPRRGRRSSGHAPGDGGRARRRDRRHPIDPGRRAEARRRAGASPLARRSSFARRRAGPVPRASMACRSRVRGGRTRCRSARSGRTRAIVSSSRSGSGATAPTSCSTSAVRSSGSSRRWRPAATGG